MSIAASVDAPVQSAFSPRALSFSFLALVLGASFLSVCLPLSVPFAAVFLFAGPHNWFELRYALGRLPARAGKLRGFFVVAGAGVVGLSVAYAALPWLAERWPAFAAHGYSLWTTTLAFWIATLTWMRSKTNPRFDAGWVWAAACLTTAIAWLWPHALPLAMVFLHPVMALVLLDRELARTRSLWRTEYWLLVGVVPLAVAAMAWLLRDAPELPGVDQITLAFGPTVRAETLTQHAGASHLPGVSAYFLVATHTFLELVHYGVWTALIPLVGMRAAPWRIESIPVTRRSPEWSWAVALFLLAGVFVVVVLWTCFALDYETTRRIYFTVAMLHVLAEAPFFLRMI